MSLTGPVFLGGLVVCTVAAFIVLILRWSSLAGRSAGKIAARSGLLLMVNELVLLTAAAQLNARFLFFADWTDLRGAFVTLTTTTALNKGATASHAVKACVVRTAATAPAQHSFGCSGGVLSWRSQRPRLQSHSIGGTPSSCVTERVTARCFGGVAAGFLIARLGRECGLSTGEFAWAPG